MYSNHKILCIRRIIWRIGSVLHVATNLHKAKHRRKDVLFASTSANFFDMQSKYGRLSLLCRRMAFTTRCGNSNQVSQALVLNLPLLSPNGHCWFKRRKAMCSGTALAFWMTIPSPQSNSWVVSPRERSLIPIFIPQWWNGLSDSMRLSSYMKPIASGLCDPVSISRFGLVKRIPSGMISRSFDWEDIFLGVQCCTGHELLTAKGLFWQEILSRLCPMWSGSALCTVIPTSSRFQHRK